MITIFTQMVYIHYTTINITVSKTNISTDAVHCVLSHRDGWEGEGVVHQLFLIDRLLHASLSNLH